MSRHTMASARKALPETQMHQHPPELFTDGWWQWGQQISSRSENWIQCPSITLYIRLQKLWGCLNFQTTPKLSPLLSYSGQTLPWVSVNGHFLCVCIDMVQVRGTLLKWLSWSSLHETHSSAMSAWTGFPSDHVLQRAPSALQTPVGVVFWGPDSWWNSEDHKLDT